MNEASRPHPEFERVLGRVDLLLFTTSAILTIDTLASAAEMGISWFTWWGITMLLLAPAARCATRSATCLGPS
jgi:hypothetical protein